MSFSLLNHISLPIPFIYITLHFGITILITSLYIIIAFSIYRYYYPFYNNYYKFCFTITNTSTPTFPLFLAYTVINFIQILLVVVVAAKSPKIILTNDAELTFLSRLKIWFYIGHVVSTIMETDIITKLSTDTITNIITSTITITNVITIIMTCD